MLVPPFQFKNRILFRAKQDTRSERSDVLENNATAKAASLVGVEVGCPPVAAAAGWAGGPRAPLVQVWLLADELTRGPARHVVPLPRRGHGHTILNSKHRLILCPLFLTWFPSVPPLLGWFSLQFV